MTYGTDRIVLQVRDPSWLHAYWELRKQTVAQGRLQLGKEGPRAEWILRVYEMEHRWFDIRLTPEAHDWAIEVHPPDRAWVVEVGLKGPSGLFTSLARSNVVRTPPDRASDRIDERWGYLKGLTPAEGFNPSSGVSSVR